MFIWVENKIDNAGTAACFQHYCCNVGKCHSVGLLRNTVYCTSQPMSFHAQYRNFNLMVDVKCLYLWTLQWYC
jgi:hypothetical protein